MQKFLKALMGVVGLAGVAGCVSVGPSPSRIPQFEEPLPSPVVIQVLDERPGEEIGAERSMDWIYYTRSPETHAGNMAQLLGNGLNATGATPGSRVASPDFPLPERVEYGIRVFYLHGYARWPVNPNQNRRRVRVEGLCQVRVELWTRGKRVARFKVSGDTNDFEVPVNIINRDTVRRVVGDSLEHQYQKCVTDMLDKLMLELTERWPDFIDGIAVVNHPGAPGPR